MLDADALRLAQFAQGSRVYQECQWTEATGLFDRNCLYGGGASNNTIGLPCGPTGVAADGRPCNEKLRMPRTWEYTAGAEREILPGVGVGADVIYRLFTYPYETRETNRIWSGSGYALDPLGSFRDGRNTTVSNLETPGAARRRYLAATGTVRKREGAFKIIGSYTWSRLEGNVYSEENNDFGNNPARDEYYLYGTLQEEVRHSVRASVTWQATRWLSTGFL